MSITPRYATVATCPIRELRHRIYVPCGGAQISEIGRVGQFHRRGWVGWSGGSASAASSPADCNEIVRANALDDEELARAIGLAVHVMRRLRRHRAALARQEAIHVARRSRLDHHWPLEANETVADLAVVMPWYALSGRKAQHLDAQI